MNDRTDLRVEVIELLLDAIENALNTIEASG
jgi:hypothetical protein